MSFLKKPFKKLTELNHSSNSNNASPDSIPSKTEGIQSAATIASSSYCTPPNRNTANRDAINGNFPHPRRENGEIMDEERKRPSKDKERQKAETPKQEAMARAEDESFTREGPPELTSKQWSHENRILFKDIDFEKMEGKIIRFRARIHTLRRMSAKLVFIVFRQQTMTIQGVLQSSRNREDLQQAEDNQNSISEEMVRNIEHYSSETIVVVQAMLRKAPIRIKNATIHNYEFEVYEVDKVSDLTEHVPFTVYDAENISRDRDDCEDDEEEDSEEDSLFLESPSKNTPRASQDVCRPSEKEPANVQDASSRSRDPTPTSQHASRSSTDVPRQQRSLPQRVRLNSRIVDLRTGPSQSIFRIQSGICNHFRSYLDSQGFIEIHTPRLQGGATESGASVFELNYFDRPAFLAQSPQLAKQMAIAADFERVYEIGPVFRAEDSNTPRHLTEYTGLDLEMALEEHYYEAITIIDGMFKSLWEGIYTQYQPEIDLISQFYPQERVQWLEETPRIPFAEGVQMLLDDGWVNEDGTPPTKYGDLATRAEVHLGALVKQKYKTDYYILDKFPASARPFYTMPDPTDDRITNSFDIFMRGQEILSGGQRIHDSEFLEKRLKSNGIQPDTMTEYLEGFRWGAPPHAGCGIGLERLTFLFLNLGNIRLASMFPRDPKSLPAKPPALKLRHEEASTTNPPWQRTDLEEPEKTNGATSREAELQPLEKLIANYGDAANTSWLDKRYHVWRHASTGAAQGYIIHNNFAIAVGEPLCAKSQQPQIISAYLQYLREAHKELRPIWMIVGAGIEEYLGEKFSWRTLACAAEERVNLRNNSALKDKNLARKVRHAEKEGVKENNVPDMEAVPEDLKQKIDARIADWQEGRSGTQVHLTQIRPWIDEEHRRYFYSQTSDGTIQAIVVLHQLSSQNGYQVKFSLEFPGAPSGTIESLILHSLKAIAAADPDARQVTFGTAAMPHLEGGRNVAKTKVKALKKVYDAINRQFALTNKSEFREKIGAQRDPVYVCYPSGGLGASGIRAIMGFLEEEG